MRIQQSLYAKLQADLQPQVLQVENESHRHGGPATESHFKLTVVADKFTGMSRVDRHRHVYGLLAEELAGGVHALALHLHAPDEWRQRGGVIPASPACRGGSQAGAGPGHDGFTAGNSVES